MADFTRIGDFTLRLSDCEKLVGAPDRRDADPQSSLHAQTNLTTLCIDGRGLGVVRRSTSITLMSSLCEMANEQHRRLKIIITTILTDRLNLTGRMVLAGISPHLRF